MPTFTSNADTKTFSPPKELQDPMWAYQGSILAETALALQYGYSNLDAFLQDLDNFIAAQYRSAPKPGILQALGVGSFPSGDNPTASALYAALDSQLIQKGVLSAPWQNVLINLLEPNNNKFVQLIKAHRPRAYAAIIYYQDILETKKRQASEPKSTSTSNNVWAEYMRHFTRDGKTPYEPAFNFFSTDKKIGQYIKEYLIRPATSPKPIWPYEMRIGASRFLVPPININVTETFKVGSMVGSALRQQSTPKFNSGYSETTIDLTIYFPNYESIWGIGEEDSRTINFDGNGDSDEIVDRFLSSLRGLIATFKYAPILPIRNEYLNKAWGITAVALSSLTVNTIENFPFCVAVNLQLLKFNHKVFLPVIDDFNTAIHWGRYRQYMGRAAQKLASTVTQGFLVQDKITAGATPPPELNDPDAPPPVPGGALIEPQEPTKLYYESEGSNTFNPSQDWNDGKHLEIYYPIRTPARVFAPDTSLFRQPEEDASMISDEDGWSLFVNHLGYDTSTGKTQYGNVNNYSKTLGRSVPELERLLAFLQWESTAVENINNLSAQSSDKMHSKDLDRYIAERVAAVENVNGPMSSSAKENFIQEIENVWFSFIFTGYRDTPFFQAYLRDAQYRNGRIIINEWEVPMTRMTFDWNKIFIQGVSVTLGNNLIPLQLQLQDEPTFQHIGGKDSHIDVSMIVFGEDELMKLRRVFDHVKGLARLEHAHGVIGFLGIKNVLTAICGIKYVLPLAYEVDSIPGFPRVYNVRLSFVDFDIFQQQRENLSSDQQQELVTAFGKRNPFLRIKQLWGSFNAYPDFPLAIRGDAKASQESGHIVPGNDILGHLDPDFYFRAYQTIDEDVARIGAIVSEFSNLKTNSEALAEINKLEQKRNEALSGAGHLTPEDRDNTAKPFNDKINYLKGRISSADGVDPLQPDFSNAGANYTDNLVPGYSGSHMITHYTNSYGDNQDQVGVIQINSNMQHTFGKYDVAGGQQQNFTEGMELKEESPGWMKDSFMPGVTTPFADHQHPTMNFSDNVTQQFQAMMIDTQYRDVSGRMIRAFPTYMLWLIDEGGRFAGVKLFDNFYGLQSVIDFSVHSSEDILGDTLVLRLSNLYQKLTTPYKAYLARQDPEQVTTQADQDRLGQLIERPIDVQRNLLSGTDPQYLVDIANIQIKPGVRVHLRMGYSANPNALQTVFNGTITTVEAGDIVTVTAQSDAIELSPYVNTADKKGDSGKIDGALDTGLWLSEPRDLMVRLLSMGSSNFKEMVASATEGMIHSENRFGIRHFGQILYETLNDSEDQKQGQRHEIIRASINRFTSSESVGDLAGATAQATGAGTAAATGASLAGGPVTAGGFQALGGVSTTRTPVIALVSAMWINFMKKRDYELFKRNIYPGNGLGIAQYLGGDAGDGGLQVALTAQSQGKVNPYAFPDAANIKQVNDPINAKLGPAAQAEEQTEGSGLPVPTGTNEGTEDLSPADPANTNDLSDIISMTGKAFTLGVNLLSGGVLGGKDKSPILQALGIRGRDDDIEGMDEISFRAQTYMKSVWDLFQLCAALQPNYIVTVRPFEDRSTVFYGKPHWLWTSAVIPLTTGVPKEGGPKYEGPDMEMQKIEKAIQEQANPLSDYESQLKYLKQIEATGNPFATQSGMPWNGGDVLALPGEMQRKGATIRLPQRQGKMCIEMHLPTSDDINQDTAQHKQLPDLPEGEKHPAYMDKVGGGHGGEGGFNVSEGAGKPGAHGFFGVLDPAEEQWYMCMFWGVMESTEAYKYARVLCYNVRTRLAVVCSIGEKGPAIRTGRVAGLSPDACHVTQAKTDDEFQFAFLPDNTPLGVTVGSDPTQAQSTVSAGTNQPTNQTIGSNETAASVSAGTQNPGTPAGLNPDNQFVTINRSVWDRLSQEGKDALGGSPKDQGNATESYLTDFAGQDLGGYVDYDIKDANKIPGLKIDIGVDTWQNMWWNDATAQPKRDQWAGLTLPQYVFKFGQRPGANQTPVFLDPMVFPSAPGFPDVGVKARTLYDKTYAERTHVAPTPIQSGEVPVISVDTAQDIWNELRERAYNVFLGDYIEIKFRKPGAGAQIREVIQGHLHDEWSMKLFEGVKNEIINKDVRAENDRYLDLVNKFMRFLWQDPIARAFVVICATSYNQNNPTGISVTHGDDWDFHVDESRILPLFRHYMAPAEGLEVNGKVEKGMGEPSDIDQVGPSDLDRGIVESDSHKKLIAFALSIQTLGAKTGTIGERIADVVDNTIGKWLKYIAMALTGVVGAFRLSLMQLGQGLGMVSNMQKQANVLNKVLNDSIYYSAGPVGSIMFLADNAFTREYAEPVIEVREPLARVHYIDSFQHILSNQIQQVTDNVPTVVTATSDGQYPVTVYFDKGMSPDKQLEIVVETGLYWDNTQGTGFFGFLHPLIHPIEFIRGLNKQATGSSDELLAKRVALWHLKEGLKDIYQGEILVLGNPDIHPYDLVYIADIYERVYGMFEVEQVIHHFTPEEGFITSITPNALVTINDPVRWSINSWLTSWWHVKTMRDTTRELLNRAQSSNAPAFANGNLTFSDLEDALQVPIAGSVQYTNGNSALVRDFASYRGTGLLGKPLTVEEINNLKGSDAGITDIAKGLGTALVDFTMPGVYMMRDIFGDLWDWMGENLVDQHNCYIQFLTKDGIPMDAGYSYNQGVAVGTHYSVNILPGLLGFPVPITQDGHGRITTDDLMSKLGWQEVAIDRVRKNVSWWVDQANSKVLDLAGVGPDNDANQLLGFNKIPVDYVTVGKVEDGDTFEDTNGVRYRFDGIDTAELVTHSNEGFRINPPEFVATQAKAFVQKRLIDDPIAQGYKPTVAVRKQGTDPFGRTIATIFHNVPIGTPDSNRETVLRDQASRTPLVPWDSYLEDGRPYTINWEMVMMGYSQTVLFAISRNDPDIGATGLG